MRAIAAMAAAGVAMSAPLAAGAGIPALAYEPGTGRYLLVVNESLPGEQRLVARTFDRAGMLVGGPEVLGMEPAAGGFPAVAADPKRGRFVIAWSLGTSVQLHIVGEDAKRIGDAIPLAGDFRRAVLVNDPRLDRFFLATTEVRPVTDRDVTARFVLPDGTAGAPFDVAASPVAEVLGGVAHDDATGRYLLTYGRFELGSPRGDVVAILISSSGDVVDQNGNGGTDDDAITIASNAYAQSVAFDPLSGRYLALIMGGPDGYDSGLTDRILDRAGRAVTIDGTDQWGRPRTDPLVSGWPKNNVAADPRGGFFVVFVPPITDVNAIRVAPDGSTSRWMRIPANGYTSGHADYPYAGYPVVASGPGTLLVAWNVYNSDHVKVAAIDVSTPEMTPPGAPTDRGSGCAAGGGDVAALAFALAALLRCRRT